MKFKDTKYGDLSGQDYKGDINISGLKLTSLEGAPMTVTGYFSCSNNQTLVSLKGAPESVGDFFDCSYNPKLTSLEGAPENVGDFFGCSNNPELSSLEGVPKNVGGGFYCHHNSKLMSLEGAPKSVGKDFDCSDNPKLTQSEIDKLVKYDIKGKINMPEGLISPTKEDYALYKKLGDRKYWKLKALKDSL